MAELAAMKDKVDNIQKNEAVMTRKIHNNIVGITDAVIIGRISAKIDLLIIKTSQVLRTKKRGATKIVIPMSEICFLSIY